MIEIGVYVGLFFIFSSLFFYVFPRYFSTTGDEKWETGRLLHQNWSLALSMFSPIIVGWSFKLRHNSSRVLVVGLFYSVSQPVAYYLLFQDDQSNIFSSNVKEIYLVLLGLLKAFWAVTVTYYIGRMPKNSDSLISHPKSNETRNFFPDQFVFPSRLRRTIFDNREKPPYDYLYERLCKDSAEIEKIMSENNLSDTEQEIFRARTAEIFNDILDEKNFYTPERFKHINCSKETEDYRTKIEDRELNKLNRLLIEDIFKEEISTSFWFTNTWKKYVSILGLLLSGAGFIFVAWRLSGNLSETFNVATIIVLAGSFIALVVSFLNLKTARINLSTAQLKQKEK